MAKVQEMTQLSPTMTEGTIVKWLKKEGDSISAGDILAEVETDKAVMEMEAYESGILLKILEADGAKLRVGEKLAVIGKPGEDISNLLLELQANKKHDTAKTAPQTETEIPKNKDPEPQVIAPPVDIQTPTSEAKDHRGKVRTLASPLARSIASEQGISLQEVIGTGPEGRITKKDVLDFISSARGSYQSLPQGQKQDRVVNLGGMRKTIAKRLTDSKNNLPHFYLNIDVNAKPIEKFRKDLIEFVSKKNPNSPQKISLNDILIKMVALALKLSPSVNASFLGDRIVEYGRVDIGVAVSLEGGLLTPVIRNADTKSIIEISQEVKDLAKRARERKLKPEEFSNGTFTISNLGMFGISRFTAIINEPEAAILAVGAVEEKPVVESGQVVVGRVLSLTLSCDHRAIDGAVGAEFLQTLKGLLENPTVGLGV